MSTEYCEWCGSSKHSSDRCPTRNLVRALTGYDYDSQNMPDLVVIAADEENLETAIEEAHMAQHIIEGKSYFKHSVRTAKK